MTKRLQPTKQRNTKKKIYGLDIETCNDNKTFLCATIISEDYCETFYDKRSLIENFKNKKFFNSIIASTNLMFDFYGVFRGQPEELLFRPHLVHGALQTAKGWFNGKKEFFYKPDEKNKEIKVKGTILFIDTLNYCKMRVEDMGKILGIPKLEIKELIGQHPKTNQEWADLVMYNKRDAEITYKFLKTLYENILAMGASVKNTAAATAMSLFTNKYLKAVYFQHDKNDLLEMFESYYGGRTECFRRGLIREKNYYDINSLYPSVMKDHDYPDPNTHRVTYKNTLEYIQDYEGISHVEVESPEEMKYPLLPVKYKQKLYFPTGKWTAWYAHPEIREAIRLGYKIRKVMKTHYFKKSCRPFDAYVTDLYEMKLKHDKEKSPLKIIDKLFLNSLYGKFGQKFINKDKWLPMNLTKEQLDQLTDFEVIDNYIRIKQATLDPAHFCFPEWACYVTCYARIKMNRHYYEMNPDYTDTDSIVSKKEISVSDKLGDFKKEMRIKEGIICKAKMYAFINADTKEKNYIKIKGINKKLDYDAFKLLLEKKEVDMIRFVKFKEALRRGLTINEIIHVVKHLSLEDEKRDWPALFNPEVLQESTPVIFTEGMPLKEYRLLQRKALDNFKENARQDLLKHISSDTFDKASVGVDIDPLEFVGEEKWWGRRGEEH